MKPCRTIDGQWVKIEEEREPLYKTGNKQNYARSIRTLPLWVFLSFSTEIFTLILSKTVTVRLPVGDGTVTRYDSASYSISPLNVMSPSSPSLQR